MSRIDACRIGRRLPGGDGWLFRDISLAVRPGERLALLGATGSGKTLLLRSLAMLDPLDAGEILCNGGAISPDSVPGFRSRVIYLHQRPPLFAGTVEENLRQPFELRVHRGKAFDKPRTLQRLRSVGRSEDFLAKPSRKLSGGEQQLVALLRALQLDPAVLLLDEPTAALDTSASQAVEKLIRDWWAEDIGKRAYVWVTHQPGQLEQIADRTLSLESGQLTEER